jgi:hypothetical protein
MLICQFYQIQTSPKWIVGFADITVFIILPENEFKNDSWVVNYTVPDDKKKKR